MPSFTAKILRKEPIIAALSLVALPLNGALRDPFAAPPLPLAPRDSVAETVRDMLSRLELPADDDLQERLTASAKLLTFLVNEFGPPKNQTFHVKVEIDNRAFILATTKFSGTNRLVTVAAINFQPAMSDDLVHEFFHGFYQSEEEWHAPRFLVESWPTYAGLRYGYRGKSNEEIKALVLKELKTSEMELKGLDLSEPSWRSANSEALKIYGSTSAPKQNSGGKQEASPGRTVGRFYSDRRNPSTL